MAVILELIEKHATLAALSGLVLIGVGIYLRSFLEELARRNLNFLLKSSSKEEVFDDPSLALIANLTNEEFRPLTSEKLIDFYAGNEDAHKVGVNGTTWQFAARLEIRPFGSGKIDEQNVYFTYSPDMFELDEHLEWATSDRLFELKQAAKGESLFNGDPFRIKDIERDGDGVNILINRCWYFDSLRTSFMMDHVVPKIGKTLREEIHGETRAFEPLSTSRLPNHMGLVVIVESSDGQLVMQRRSKNVQIRPNTLSSSVSGTFEKRDLEFPDRKIHLGRALQGVAREMQGELGGTSAIDFDNFRFMGLAREFRRGGFPDFYFLYQSKLKFSEIKEFSQEAEETFEVDALEGFYVGSSCLKSGAQSDRLAFEARLDDLLHRIEGEANLTLSFGIALFCEARLRQYGYA